MRDRNYPVVPAKRLDVAYQLREVALPFLLEKGFDDVTATDIAQALQISRRTFFRYFPMKEDVVIGAFAEFGSCLASALRQTPEGTPFDFDLLQDLLIDAAARIGFYDVAGRGLFALTVSNSTLRARFVSLLEISAVQFTPALIERDVELARASLFVRMLLTLIVEASDRWSKNPGDSIEKHIKDVVTETSEMLDLRR